MSTAFASATLSGLCPVTHLTSLSSTCSRNRSTRAGGACATKSLPSLAVDMHGEGNSQSWRGWRADVNGVRHNRPQCCRLTTYPNHIRVTVHNQRHSRPHCLVTTHTRPGNHTCRSKHPPDTSHRPATGWPRRAPIGCHQR